MTTYTKIAVKGAATILVISLIAAFLGYIVRVILAKNLSIEATNDNKKQTGTPA